MYTFPLPSSLERRKNSGRTQGELEREGIKNKNENSERQSFQIIIVSAKFSIDPCTSHSCRYVRLGAISRSHLAPHLEMASLAIPFTRVQRRRVLKVMGEWLSKVASPPPPLSGSSAAQMRSENASVYNFSLKQFYLAESNWLLVFAISGNVVLLLTDAEESKLLTFTWLKIIRVICTSFIRCACLDSDTVLVHKGETRERRRSGGRSAKSVEQFELFCLAARRSDGKTMLMHLKNHWQFSPPPLSLLQQDEVSTPPSSLTQKTWYSPLFLRAHSFLCKAIQIF